MVKFHQTVDTYLCPGSARTTSNRKLMEQALMGAKILMIAGHEALRVESLDTHIRGIFERYFGPCTQSKKLGVGRESSTVFYQYLLTVQVPLLRCRS